ncbi:MAG: thioesterase [Chloroflexota bacterium]|nr:MAG: thioesterase [Chloroflexota bacterium]
MNRKRFLLGVGIALLALALLGAGAFVYWANDAAQPLPEALAALQSDEQVQFSNQNGWLVFQPVNQSNTLTPLDTGLIFYPGGRVDYRAYAPLARDIAAQGYLVVIPPMPLNLAFFGTNMANEIVRTFPEIQHWAIGGHSLGGVAAATYANAHRAQIQGIVLYASYPADNQSAYPGRVTSIFGTNDGLATPAKIAESKPNLPAQTLFAPIEGGNHSQFGFYGDQTGDNPATISRAEQQKQTVKATVEMLSRLQ